MESQLERTGLALSLSAVNLLEVQMVAQGLKPSARIKVPRNRNVDLIEWLESLHLQFAMGFEAVQTSRDPEMASEWASFSNGDFESDLESYLYIAPEKVLAEALRDADERCDILEAGALLGYPDCCTHYFSELATHRSIAKNPIFFTYRSGLMANWVVNTCLLNGGFALVTHVPCSPNCLATLDLAGCAFSVLFEIQPAVARMFCAAMCSTVLFGRDGSFACFGVVGSEQCYVISEVRLLSSGHFLKNFQLEGQHFHISEKYLHLGPITLLTDEYKCYQFK